MAGCLTCELVRRRDGGDTPAWDHIVRTPGWDVVHAYDTSVEGWVVLAARRHITAVADMTDAEASELGPLVAAVSRGLRAVVGCAKTYVVQFAEHPRHPHVHVHVIPRAPDLSPGLRGPAIFSQVGVPSDRAVPEARRNEIALALRPHLPT